MTSPQPLQDLIAALTASLRDQSFVKMSLGGYTGSEIDLKNVHIKPVLIKRQNHLSFTYRYKTRDIVKNFSFEDGATKINAYLMDDFQTATLFTTTADWQFENFKNRKPALKENAPTHTEPPSLSHDRDKNRLISTQGKSYLHDLKITDAAGNVLKNAQDKYRQINKYVEILDSLIKNIPAGKLKKIVDMGSGKGYLTFALYDYLATTLKNPVEIVGVEFRQDMVDLCNRIARDAKFDGLHFVQNTIEHYDAANANILIALHACDTATDDAIAKGIQAEADLIVVAPCCHKQIRREIEKHAVSNDLDFLTQHGIFLERQAEMVTDGLRALILEYFGYTTKIFEFISDVHTPKNILIVGTKTTQSPAEKSAALAKIQAAKKYFGIGHHHLEQMTGLNKK